MKTGETTLWGWNHAAEQQQLPAPLSGLETTEQVSQVSQEATA